MSRSYYPNREPLVVLECGCITSQWLYVHEMAGKDYQRCDNHPEAPHRLGQRILREAKVHECYEWYFHGKPAAKRASSRSPDWVRILSA